MTYRSELYLIKSDNTEIPANIIANTLYLNKSYCEEEQLEIGGCIPSQFKCSVYGIEDITDIVKLKYIRYSNDEPDISFEGNIAELTSTSNDGIYNITAYDELYNQADISEWYNNYMANNEVVTISQLYSAVLEKLGLTSGSVITNYITYDFVIKQNILSNNIAGTRLLKWICEALGVFGILNTYTSTNETENGISYITMTTFSLNVLGPKPKTAIRPTTVFSGFQKSDYICKKMDKVQIRSEEEDIGAIYGTGTNALIIEGNPLFYGMDASELEKCAKQISGNIKDNSDYTAYEAELVDSDTYINNVDIYQCYPISSSTSRIYSYIFNITCSGSQLTTCKIGANGVETRSEVLTSTNSEIIKLNYKTTSIVKNVDGIKTEVSSISSKANNAVEKADKALTSVEQTDKYIEANVVKNDEVVTKINASQEGVSIKADKISLEGYTTINDNFKIDEHGDMEAKNGKFSGEITSKSGTIGGFTLTDKLSAKGTAYLPPSEADFNKIRNAVVNSTTAQLYNENPWFDLDGNGKVDVYDFGYMRKILLGHDSYSSMAHKKLSEVTVEINPTANKLIRIYGTNAWGSLIEIYIGAVSCNINNLILSSLTCKYGITLGTNSSWVNGDGLTADKITAQGDVIAGLGTSNQVSLIGLKDDLMGEGSAYANGWEEGASTLKANTNTMIYAETILKTGVYLFVPSFRTTLPSGHIFSVGIFDYKTLQYPVTQYMDMCTMIGTGRKRAINGIQIFNAIAGKRYYVMGYSTADITLDSTNWFHIFCLKTT